VDLEWVPSSLSADLRALRGKRTRLPRAGRADTRRRLGATGPRSGCLPGAGHDGRSRETAWWTEHRSGGPGCQTLAAGPRTGAPRFERPWAKRGLKAVAAGPR